jgi:hypothetical protein
MSDIETIDYNTQHTTRNVLVSELTLPYLINLSTEADFGTYRSSKEEFVVNCSNSLEDVKKFYQIASKAHNLVMDEECSDFEVREFTEDFSTRLQEIFPHLKDDPENGNYFIDYESIETKNFTYIYLLICTLAEPNLKFQFTSFPCTDIGGAGLFYFS